jgi:serine-type D-Ala-D-Ala carboxypeptidase/endopeptidase (penicillin-binding protein 4)
VKSFLIFLFACLALSSFSQERASDIFLSDPSMMHASVSICIADAENGEIIMDYGSGRSLIPASVMKLVTSSVSLELLGPEYTFKTVIGYTGTIDRATGNLTGDIIIRGGGDPSLGSKYFADHYNGFLTNWVSEIKKLGIKRVYGRVIADDSYFDYLPVPAKWLWEDAGNYYGAGAYGLSVFDNIYEIHLKTSSDSSQTIVKEVVPYECRNELTNWLVASGTSDEGYVFAAPYSTRGWLSGTIPVNRDDFILKASITDPPLLLSEILNKKLEAEGIDISGDPTTLRIEQKNISEEVIPICVTVSPALSEIIEVLNHESVNLFAEHLLKELGKKYRDKGSTDAGIKVIIDFLQSAGIKTDGMFIEDGSGLSPLDAVNSSELVALLGYLKHNGKFFRQFFSSLPEAGREGTLKSCFRDPVFNSRLSAKSGSMTRVRSYAGYFITATGKDMIFSIIINNYSGPSNNIITGIENIIKEIILSK